MKKLVGCHFIIRLGQKNIAIEMHCAHFINQRFYYDARCPFCKVGTIKICTIYIWICNIRILYNCIYVCPLSTIEMFFSWICTCNVYLNYTIRSFVWYHRIRFPFFTIFCFHDKHFLPYYWLFKNKWHYDINQGVAKNSFQEPRPKK